MNRFSGKTAIVTGGASGIGRAVGEELVRRGARVVLADIDAMGVEEAARALGKDGSVKAAAIDVTDPVAVEGLVQDTVTDYGRLDFIFNNAGIVTFGETRDMSLADWNGMIDVNLRGVVHGVAAAYPVMIRQGFGHIVNTASAAGLAPAPGATCYAATKHAVVGLSTSLRAEAAGFGVKVSVVCPGFIDTPMKYNAKLLNTDHDTALKSFPFKMHPAEECAQAILRGVARNKSIIVVTNMAKLGWLLYRLSPSLMTRALQLGVERSPMLDRKSQ
jgi:NAD(P)-dependent dehydrogenase (short-subunit alcohol dehydrogenase family)